MGQIEDRGLEQYLAQRGIPLDLARLYLKEVAYRVGDQSYRALAFPNDAGGYELRNPRFKGSLGTKEIRYLAGDGRHQAAVFEGFFDFLSVLALYRQERARADVLVLNSLGLMTRGIARLEAEAVTRIHAYLDRDEAGRNGHQQLTAHPGWIVEDGSRLYAGHKDANDFLAASRRILHPSSRGEDRSR